MKSFNYGDIVLVKLSNGPDTNEKTVTGYAVVISADAINENLQTVIVCPLIEAKHVSDTRIGVTLIPKKA
ncbi:MAG: type II toxin-antitoxin system PemK/MazF family toxin, partial [bacterium]